ncbi:MAG TPA: hypothetical protein VHX86_19635 [Tepidisphaeraceae bacterium]|jgi:hypothetical protein|nr:hypothetical protein [Tepidisphaeraceae bacterium]
MIRANQKLRIIVGGLVGQFPLGGVAWDYFHYVLGLDQLGHDVYYHEDTWVWPFQPVLGYATDDPSYTVKFIADFFEAHAPNLNEKWHYLLCHEKHFGMSGERFREVAQSADIFLNVSGACFVPEELGPHCVKVFMDTDPGYNQIMLSEKFAWSDNVQRWCDLVANHDRHLTYAENIYGSDCLIPRLNFDWRPTRCVVTLPQWSTVRDSPPPADAPMTTVMTWDWFRGKLTYKGAEYFAKVVEFEKFHELPALVKTPLELALNGVKAPLPQLANWGWRVVDAQATTLTPQSYQDFIARSAGEWSVAKNVYAATHSGWFSCRTACYLASARPAVVQETGWSRFVPGGRGVIPFSTMDEAVAGIEAVAADPVGHRKAAYEIAREYLAPEKVLPEMIESICAKPVKPEIRNSNDESNSKSEI